VCGMSMNTYFHGGSNETIGGRVRLRRPELLPFWFKVVLEASGAFNQGVWGVYGCVFFMVVPMTPSAAASDPGGRRYCCLIVSTVFSLLSLTPAIKLLPGVVDTDQKKPKSLKFIAGVNDTAEKLFTGVNDTADKFFGGANDTGE
jgi:hypothetical protein